MTPLTSSAWAGVVVPMPTLVPVSWILVLTLPAHTRVKRPMIRSAPIKIQRHFSCLINRFIACLLFYAGLRSNDVRYAIRGTRLIPGCRLLTGLCIRSEIAGKAQGGVPRDTVLLSDDLVDAGRRDAQLLFAQNLAWVDWPHTVLH